MARLSERGHGPAKGQPEPSSAVGWPQWQDDFPVTAPGGHPYVLAALRMSVLNGRHRQQHRLVENDRLPVRLAPLFSALPVSHSLLQEPHGGQHCRFSSDGPRIWRDSDPDRWPNTLYRRLAAEDGPREGIGEVTVTLHLRTRDGHSAQFSRIISECNVRSDGRLILTQLPDRLSGA